MVTTAFVTQQLSNGAKEAVDTLLPYRVSVTVEGVAPLLLHAWNNESVDEKAKAAKNSAAKKTDNVESYVYRDSNGLLGLPGPNFVASLVEAGRSIPDPRSPRKSARDLCRAGIVPLTLHAAFEPHTTQWDYEDRRRVTVQRAGITRTRPAMKEGWRATFELLINTPEYIPPALVNQLVSQAGRLVGLCDFRPSYGRFALVAFEVLAA
jgi:hypothetical protein